MVKTGRLKRSQFSILFLSCENLRKCFILFTYILIDYLFHEITKEFWENSHFENMRAGFLLRCQKSLWCKISLICLWNIESLNKNWLLDMLLSQKLVKISSTLTTYRLHLGTILVKTFFFHAWTCIISGVFHRSEF